MKSEQTTKKFSLVEISLFCRKSNTLHRTGILERFMVLTRSAFVPLAVTVVVIILFRLRIYIWMPFVRDSNKHY